ncbi:hypothetical protein DSECCO2_636920 [anaerobic digester metagenome]
MAGKTTIPSQVMRNVCIPGRVGCPRIFKICILRTIEFRWTLCASSMSPSARVKIGGGFVSEA